ncbi:hypothetical protein [Nonomuraea sp. JJY05]|uniref:hypothetical protein n=1 Tax=Nonomuraea sp. JJY05 TaxID=3350255 RepID=UPI00373F9D83
MTGFGTVTTTLLRVSLTGKVPSEVYTPTMTEIAVYRAAWHAGGLAAVGIQPAPSPTRPSPA